MECNKAVSTATPLSDSPSVCVLIVCMLLATGLPEDVQNRARAVFVHKLGGMIASTEQDLTVTHMLAAEGAYCVCKTAPFATRLLWCYAACV